MAGAMERLIDRPSASDECCGFVTDRQSSIDKRKEEGAMKEITVPELLRILEALRAKLDGLGSYL
ncbi:MAG TPA: hypothetical protein VED18_15170 [Candidatus Sulfotelmatobacter sp.]|nr:hypothetical protein [Candidatus Sulfotelmatobacter sp.]